MAAFSYDAVDQSGRIVEGEVEAPDRAAALLTIKKQGLFPTRIQEKRAAVPPVPRQRVSGRSATPLKIVALLISITLAIGGSLYLLSMDATPSALTDEAGYWKELPALSLRDCLQMGPQLVAVHGRPIAIDGVRDSMDASFVGTSPHLQAERFSNLVIHQGEVVVLLDVSLLELVSVAEGAVSGGDQLWIRGHLVALPEAESVQLRGGGALEVTGRLRALAILDKRPE